MYFTFFGLRAWGLGNRDLAMVYGTGGFGCSVMRGGITHYQENVAPTDPTCDDWEQELQATIPAGRERYGRADAVLVQYGPWDFADRQLPGSDEWHHVGEPVVDDYLRREMTAMTDVLLAQGVEVIWVTAPAISSRRDRQPPPDPPLPESDPARVARYNEIVHEVADARQGATVVDLQAYLESLPGGALDARLDDGSLMRPDGVHFTRESVAAVTEDWLGAAVLDAVDDEPHPPAPERPDDGAA
jgi:hypothetical protein